MSFTSASLPSPRNNSVSAQQLHDLVCRAEHAQWRDERRIARDQLGIVRDLLTHAIAHSPYYSKRFKGLDVRSLGWKDFQQLPTLSREELRSAKAEIDCRSVPKSHGALSSTMTSGSTGSPVEVRITGLVGQHWYCNALRDHLWHQRDASLTTAGIRWRAENEAMAPEGWDLTNWGEPHSQFYLTGKAFVLNSSSSTTAQLEWLLARNPHYLISHPSNLRALLVLMAERSARPENLLQVRTVGEQVSEDLRQLVSQVLGVPLIDAYTSQEIGYMALQCPLHNHYHVLSDSVVLEVVDSEGKACEPGELGRVLVTSLRNFATPLIRYDVGDMAIRGGSCDCGRGLPVVEKLVGRVRNMLQLPDGSTHWPNFGLRKIMDVVPLKQFQLRQRDLQTIEFHAVLTQQLTPQQESAIRDILIEHLGFPFTIEFNYPNEIPRSANGKYEDFVSLLPN